MKRYKVFVGMAVSIILFLVTSSNVYAGGMQNFFYIKYDGEKEVWVEEELNLGDVDTEYEKAYVVISNLFSVEGTSFIPKDIKILDTYLLEDCIVLNVSKDINNYGGTYYEKRLIAQIVKNILGIEGVNKVTLLIDGEDVSLNEGIFIREVDEIDFFEELQY